MEPWAEITRASGKPRRRNSVFSQLGPFEILDQLGVGGMATVYRARYTKTNQLLALKILSPEAHEDARMVARFQRELDILRQLKHPRIVQCYGGGRIGQHRFFAMELVEGGTLGQKLREQGAIAWPLVVEYGEQICQALHHAHQHGVIHRDIKPGNLMLDRQGRIKLTDFGLARLIDATGLTVPGRTLGTFAYMAPEQITSKYEISPRTDLYGLGVVLFELLTAQTPFQAVTTNELLTMHLEAVPPSLRKKIPACPEALEKLVFQLLEKDPQDRPLDAQTAAKALSSLIEIPAHGKPQSIPIPSSASPEQGAVSIDLQDSDLNQPSSFLGLDRGKLSFVVGVLSLFLAICVWSFWPLSEEELFEYAQPAMKSVALSDWQRARARYLEPLLNRFPESRHAPAVKEFLEKIEVTETEQRLLIMQRRNIQPQFQAEIDFLRAYAYEKFGDGQTAAVRYAGIVQQFHHEITVKKVVDLSRYKLHQIERSPLSKLSPEVLLKAQLDKAELQKQAGNLETASSIWTNIKSLYSERADLATFVERAQNEIDLLNQ